MNLWLSLGHTLHVLHSRRLTFGLYVLTGLTHYASEGHFTNSREMIADSFSTANDILALGVRLKVAIDSAAT